MTQIRMTKCGKVQGFEQNGAEAYYGIPYGQNPVGELRWAAPIAPTPWDDVRDCTEKETPAMQMIHVSVKKEDVVDQRSNDVIDEEMPVKTVPGGTTDCLNLDVYTTKHAYNYPVLVFLHGGNNQAGSSYGDIEGHDLAVKDDCVVVCLNFRLGFLGFLALPSIVKEGMTGNFGLLDIAFALRWVRENIVFFGGDPQNVTISGFSAGGRNVMAMLKSPVFHGLFEKAISFSGGITICDAREAALIDAKMLAPLVVEDRKRDCKWQMSKKEYNEQDAAAWLLQDKEEVREYLYGISDERLTSVMQDAGIRMARFPHLFADDVVLPAVHDRYREDALINSGIVNDVPLMMLTGTSEFTVFCASDDCYAFVKNVEEREAARRFAFDYGSELYRIFNTQLSAQQMAKTYQSPMYLAQINYGGKDSATTIPVTGSFHGVCLPMLSSAHHCGDHADFDGVGYRKMADIFHRYLRNFLYTGNPNIKNSTDNMNIGSEKPEGANTESTNDSRTKFTGEDHITKWHSWNPKTRQTLILDGDETEGTASAIMRDVFSTNQKIIADMEADDRIDEETKYTIISTILNGRWFSEDCDRHFGVF